MSKKSKLERKARLLATVDVEGVSGQCDYAISAWFERSKGTRLARWKGNTALEIHISAQQI